MPTPPTALEPGLVLPAEMTPAIRDVLGMMIYTSGPIAHGFRAVGCDIPRKAEEEQAFVLFWLLKHAIKHGDDWRKHAAPELPVAPTAEVRDNGTPTESERRHDDTPLDREDRNLG